MTFAPRFSNPSAFPDDFKAERGPIVPNQFPRQNKYQERPPQYDAERQERFERQEHPRQYDEAERQEHPRQYDETERQERFGRYQERPPQYDAERQERFGQKGKGAGAKKGSGKGCKNPGGQSSHAFVPFVKLEQACKKTGDHSAIACMGKSHVEEFYTEIRITEAQLAAITKVVAICPNEKPFQRDETTGRVYTERCSSVTCTGNHFTRRDEWMKKQCFYLGKKMLETVAAFHTANLDQDAPDDAALAKLGKELLKMLDVPAADDMSIGDEAQVDAAWNE